MDKNVRKVDTSNMPKTGKLEWGHYKEYLTLNFICDFENIKPIDKEHVVGVVKYMYKGFVIAAVLCYLASWVPLLQWKIVSGLLGGFFLSRLANLASYDTRQREEGGKVVWGCTGCLAGSIFHSFGTPYYTTATWFLYLAVISYCYTMPYTTGLYIKRLLDEYTHANDDKTEEEKKQQAMEKKNENNKVTNLVRVCRPWHYILGPVFAAAGFFAVEFLLSIIISISVLSSVAKLTIVAVMGSLYFVNGQFIIGKSGYYDRDPLWHAFEMIPETLLSTYYVPASIINSS